MNWLSVPYREKTECYNLENIASVVRCEPNEVNGQLTLYILFVGVDKEEVRTGQQAETFWQAFQAKVAS